ncbi:MAG: hypothetical protein MJZ87_05750 [Bacteroidales bacterium]|nr:hypothetical protein [Bacteroidales bacterium]
MFEAQNKQLTLQDKFDLAKKLSEGGTANTGFCIDGQVYNAYLTNDEWSDFVKTMPTEIAIFFDNGQGGDMRERKTCFGNYIPPKMSSYGSSSRMLYELAKDIPDFIFKYKMPAIIGGKAHLDGYLKKGNIYMDAKCREIYGGQGDVKNVYDPYYAYLFRKTLLRYFRYGKLGHKGSNVFKFETDTMPLSLYCQLSLVQRHCTSKLHIFGLRTNDSTSVLLDERRKF